MQFFLWAKTSLGITQIAATKTREDAELLMQNYDQCYITQNGTMVKMKNWV